jgi:MFS family permease
MKFIVLERNVYFSFFIYSFCFGAFFPRLGDLQLKMGIGEAVLGLALVGLPLGVQISLLLADQILETIGFRIAMCLGVPALGMSLVLSALAVNPTWFFCALAVGGFAVGIVEVAVNLEADRAEYHVNKKIMNRSHSFWSLGFFVAGLAGAIASQIEISPLIHFSTTFLGCSILTISFFLSYEPFALRPNVSKKSSIFVRPTKSILALVVFTLSAMLIEGAGIDWSIIFMRVWCK